MSGVSRVLRTARSLQSDHTPFSSSSLSFWVCSSLGLPTREAKTAIPLMSSNGSFWVCSSLGLPTRGAKTAIPLMSSNGRKKSPSASLQQTTVSTTEEEETKKPTDMKVISTAEMMLLDLQLQSQAARIAARRIGWTLRVEMIVERAVVGCQSFAMIAVAGSLIGSVLCFVEGCSFVLKSFFEFFVTVTEMLDRGGIIQLLIQAVDMFLMGSALLTFGMGMYDMFIQSKDTQRRSQIAESNLFGLFNLKRLSESIQMQSITRAKARIVHAVALLLQAGMVDKFRNVPLTSGLDVACFAGALLNTSATVFLLSKLVHRVTNASENV